MNIRKIKSKGAYAEIIEVRCPTRFYWDKEGRFDGLEVGPFSTPLTESEFRLLQRLLLRLASLLGDGGAVKVRGGKGISLRRPGDLISG